MNRSTRNQRRGTILLMIVGLLAMLFMIIAAYITLARFDRLTLAQSTQGAQVEQILETVNELIASDIATSWTDEQTGELEFGGDKYADIPGVGGSTWLASSSPVRDVYDDDDDPLFPNDPNAPVAYRYPAVTSVSGSALGLRLNELMFDRPNDNDGAGYVYINPKRPQDGDTLYNARRAFMDADGDGIADSCFVFDPNDPNDPDKQIGIAMLTELANVMGDRNIRTHGLNPSDVPDPSTFWPPNSDEHGRLRAWEQFDNDARYLAAVRVISHGGMVSLGLPMDQDGYGQTWNREFSRMMFDWVRYPGDGNVNDFDDSRSLSDVWRNRTSIEPLLRLRGGLLMGEFGNDVTAVPDPLAYLLDEFPRTLVPQFDGRGLNNGESLWQRFNLASDNGADWNAWRHAIAMDADWYNETVGTSGSNNPRSLLARRPLLTTVNFSDELARKEFVPDDDSSVSYKRPEFDDDGDKTSPGIFPGQTKYYLGRINDVFLGNLSDVSDDGKFDPDIGALVIAELADYYAEMIYDYWEFGPSNEEAVTLDEQAYMLAVNTVAFAAPRYGKHDKIDVVYGSPPDEPGKIYVGYTPQPFFTQAIAYNDPDLTGDTAVDQIAVGVELFYPGEADWGAWSGNKFDNNNDDFALNLEQFAISLNKSDEGSSNLRFLDSVLNAKRLSGRSFISFSINDMGTNTAFDPGVGDSNTDGVIGDMPVNVMPKGDPTETSPERIEIKLWKQHSQGALYLVDRITIELQEGEHDTVSDEQKWLRDTYRDTNGMHDDLSSTSYYRADGDTRQARWRMVANITRESPLYEELITPDPNDPFASPDRQMLLRRPTIGNEFVLQGGVPALPTPFAQPAPLYTMNAGLHPTMIHGAARPASFPTVGFLLFVPRYSHVVAGEASTPMSEILREEVEDKDDPALADFGHMPIFDNRQDAELHTLGMKAAGQIPWGLRVFDYFTTLNPFDANGDGDYDGPGDVLDPYRVAGRININTASWFVLAGLPVIDPDAGANRGISQYASPAFWSTDSGVLVGRGEDDNDRFLGDDSSSRRLWQVGNTWRLGPYLAQAAASYRDRVQYASDEDEVEPVLQNAWLRNAAVTNGQYRPTTYGTVRRNANEGDSEHPVVESDKRGFLTIGELANVVGFDSSNDDELDSGNGLDTTLGKGDFMKAVSLLALLDTHFLTTRTNTFTIYSTLAVHDPDDTQSSIRSQITIDRSNLLPRLVRDASGNPMLQWIDENGDGDKDDGEIQPVVLRGTGLPEVIAERQVEYFNARDEN